MQIAFLGMGGMGRAMAARLAEAGHDLAVWNRTPGRADGLTGVRPVTTPRDAARGAGVVFTMLADDAATEAVVFGDDGFLDTLAPGATHACTGTISAGLSARLAAAHRERGQRYIAAPVFGRPEAAAQGQLWVIAAGDPAGLQACRPLLETFGREIIEAGDDPAHASVLKLAGNLVLLAMVEALGESYALVRAHGIDVGLFHDFIAGRLFASPRYDAYGRRIVEQEFDPPGFALGHALKDIRYALRAADDAGLPAPLVRLLRDRLAEADAKGLGNLDVAALARLEQP
jgi:3-hydroxyisobutyrate dehydrogenase-like beta-hydroxyacid dehydrogenase